MQASAKPQTFTDLIDAIEVSLNRFVDEGTDHELFIAGYLHGHFSLIASQVEQSDAPGMDSLDKALSDSLQAAFDNDELEKTDQRDVWRLWSQLRELA